MSSNVGSQAVCWVWLGLVLVLAGLLGPGCGPPQVARHNREIVLKLATATSTQNAEWLELSAEEVEELQASGELSKAEHRVFWSIIEQARGGDWERARQSAYKLRDAQRPTAEDRQIVQKRRLPKPKTLPDS